MLKFISVIGLVVNGLSWICGQNFDKLIAEGLTIFDFRGK